MRATAGPVKAVSARAGVADRRAAGTKPLGTAGPARGAFRLYRAYEAATADASGPQGNESFIATEAAPTPELDRAGHDDPPTTLLRIHLPRPAMLAGANTPSEVCPSFCGRRSLIVGARCNVSG